MIFLLQVTPSSADYARRLIDINTGPGGSDPWYLTNVNDVLYFIATDDGSNSGYDLWRSGGTAETTMKVKDFTDSSGWYLTYVDNGEVWLYFSASDGGNDRELWKSDGTLAGTALVRNINTLSSSSGSYPEELIDLGGGWLLFSADDGIHGRELWKSGGLESNTQMVMDINLLSDDSNPRNFINVGGMLYFIADDGTHGRELWISDGTEANTRMVKNITTNESLYTQAMELTNVAGTLFFRAYDEVTNKLALWKSNGTEATTMKVADINPSTLTSMNGKLYFVGGDPAVYGQELWTSDGTPAGTEMVRDIYPDSGSSYIHEMVNVNGLLYLSARGGVNGSGLWISDGTPIGTEFVEEFTQSNNMNSFTNVHGILYFSAEDATYDAEPWKSSGSEVSTERVADVNPTGSSTPRSFIGCQVAVCFVASDDSHGTELWVASKPIISPAINLLLLK
jgi:ELWxxDGT repeat protein